MSKTEDILEYSCEGTYAIDAGYTVDPEENSSNMFILNCTTAQHKIIPLIIGLFKSESKNSYQIFLEVITKNPAVYRYTRDIFMLALFFLVIM
jgi:hypothetical protein